MSRPVWRALGINCLMLVAVGLLAVGVSGLIAAAMNSAIGPQFVAGDLPGNTYTADRCADLMEYAPTATTCADAAAIHHTDEVVTSRLAAGLLGFVALATWLGLRRRADAGDLPAGLVDAAGVSMFGIVGLGLSVVTLNSIVLGGDGAGAFLSAAIVSLVVALYFGVRLITDLQSWSRDGRQEIADE